MIHTAGSLSNEYLNVIQKIDLLRKQLKYLASGRPRRWIGLLRRSTFARAIQGSNSIEGYNVTHEDAVAAIEGDEPIDAQSETWLAVSGYRAAMSYILQLADDPHYAHNEGTIRSLHYMMVGFDLVKHPGRWRPGDIYVRNDASGEIVYEGPPAEMVPQLMAELVQSLNESSEQPALVRAAMAHLNLVMIHPFSDGNGRMGRALQTMVLSREGVYEPTFSSIEEYLGRNTQEYYAVLANVGQGSWHPGNDSLPWIRFCLVAHYRQAETLLRRTKEMEHLWSYLETEVKSRGLNERVNLALADAAMGFRIRNSSYRKVAEISDEVAGKDLRLLVDHRLLVPQGEKRGRYYIAGDWLRSLRAFVRQRKIVTEPFSETRVIEPDPAQDILPGLSPK